MATITSLNSTDTGSVSRPVINTNFDNLNTDKIEADSTEALTNKTINTSGNTITVVASDVSDFDTEVANNSAVTANTAKVTYPSADSTKLAGIEALADVTDATNVASSGGVLNTGNETIAGIKTFSSSPIVPAPTTDLQASTKKYVDDNAGGTPEGTAVLSTGETVGKVLQADGDDTCSWVALAGGGDALTANPLSQFAATTSLQLKGVLSDETGSGAAVFATSPALSNPTGLDSNDVGLANVDNTSDATKDAAATALTNKTSYNGLALTENADGFDIAGGSVSERTLTVSGGDVTITAGTPAKGDILVGDGTDLAAVSVGTTGQIIIADSSQSRGVKYVDDVVTLNFVIDGGGAAITTGIKGDIQLDFAGTIQQVTALADQSGSIVVDIWKDSYANFPATDADSITASAPPTITTAVKSQDSTLTGWTTIISVGDHLRFNVDSITTCERVTVALKIKKIR